MLAEQALDIWMMNCTLRTCVSDILVTKVEGYCSWLRWTVVAPMKSLREHPDSRAAA